jgi:hypothetical protein
VLICGESLQAPSLLQPRGNVYDYVFVRIVSDPVADTPVTSFRAGTTRQTAGITIAVSNCITQCDAHTGRVSDASGSNVDADI